MHPAIAPLLNIRIVTIALNVPGPMAVERLHALGASVLKVEPPTGDPLAASSPQWYAKLADGMDVQQCDLKSATGMARMHEWLDGADLFLTSQRPAALARLDLDWETLHRLFPRLCQVAMVGYPEPNQNVAGHDLTYLAAKGLLAPPGLPPTLFADVAGSEQAALAALAVLLGRERTAGTQYVEVAISEAVERLAAPRRAGLTAPGAILGGGFPGYNLYRTQDGWLAVAALEPHFYERLCRQLGVAAPTYEAFAARFELEPDAYWRRFAQDNDLPIAPLERA